MQENNLKQTGESKKSFFSKYGIILSILIGAWIIGMSIILGSWLIVRHLQGNTVSGVQKINLNINEADSILGNSDAAVTLYEYADFQCPFCKQFQDTIMPWLKKEYIDTGKVNFVFRDFAFLGPESTDAAAAAACAKEQNKFWEYHDMLYASQGAENAGVFNLEALKSMAEKLGLNKEQFDSCLSSGNYQNTAELRTQEASSLGISSTPTLIISGTPYEGLIPQNELRVAIDNAIDTAQKEKQGVWYKIKQLFK